MRIVMILVVIISIISFAAGSSAPERTVDFPRSAANDLGQIERLVVKVACGRISSLRNIPELYNIEMEYDIPTENILEARPRLGAAAVELSRWDGVIAVSSDSDDCFSVKVEIEGSTGKRIKWTDRQLGLGK